jgi:hypothetical protein
MRVPVLMRGVQRPIGSQGVRARGHLRARTPVGHRSGGRFPPPTPHLKFHI